MKKLFNLITFFVFCMPIIVGCGAELLIGPAVTAICMWIEGEAHKYYPYNADVVYRASKRALKDMGLEITKDEPTKAGHFIIAVESNRFRINIVNIKEDICRLNLRVDFMGDKDYAELFYSKVDDQLSTIRFNDNGEPMLAPEN